MGSMRCVGKKSIQVFQRALIISLKSLRCLFENIKEKHNECSFTITHRPNQDCLENFFSQLITRGGLHDHPSPLNAIYRIRMIMLGRNPGVVQLPEQNAEFLVATALKQAKITELQLEPLSADSEIILDVQSLSSTTSSSSSGGRTPSGINYESERDGVLYVAGYLAFKHKDKYPELVRQLQTFIHMQCLLGYSIFPLED